MAIRQRLSPEESRKSALEAARILLIETGPQSVTLKAVSAKIGKTHANLLHHFGSAAGLQKALAAYLAQNVCDTILLTVEEWRAGHGTARDVVDLVFDAFGEGGAGALTSWMLLTGNEDALDPVIEVIHNLIHDIAPEEVELCEATNSNFSAPESPLDSDANSPSIATESAAQNTHVSLDTHDSYDSYDTFDNPTSTPPTSTPPTSTPPTSTPPTSTPPTSTPPTSELPPSKPPVLDEGTSEFQALHEVTLTLVLLALGDALIGKTMARTMGIPESNARQNAGRMLVENLGLKSGENAGADELGG